MLWNIQAVFSLAVNAPGTDLSALSIGCWLEHPLYAFKLDVQSPETTQAHHEIKVASVTSILVGTVLYSNRQASFEIVRIDSNQNHILCAT